MRVFLGCCWDVTTWLRENVTVGGSASEQSFLHLDTILHTNSNCLYIADYKDTLSLGLYELKQ